MTKRSPRQPIITIEYEYDAHDRLTRRQIHMSGIEAALGLGVFLIGVGIVLIGLGGFL
jgi:hypothetical protein